MALRIYVTGPGESLSDIRKACQWGEQIRNVGMFPYLSHLNKVWDGVCPPTHKPLTNYWQALELEWMSMCHAAFVFGGVPPSIVLPGPLKNGLVFRDFSRLCAWAKSEEQRLKDCGLWESVAADSTGEVRTKRAVRWTLGQPMVRAVGGTMLPSPTTILPGCPGHDPVRARETGPKPGDWPPESD